MKKYKKFLGFISIILGLILTVAPYARAVELVISENGSGSQSVIETEIETTTNIEQTNQADIANDIEVESNTGGNSASGNTGGEVAIDTGDIQEQITVENSVNTSIVETGCCPGDTSLTIEGNGADSQNKIEFENETDTEITINQTANITNKIEGTANTGENTANDNTGGNVSIDTGNIFVSGGVENGPINSASVIGASGGGGVSAKIAGNGADSINNIEAEFENDVDVFLNFNSDIDNFINWDLNTGKNEADDNTDADISRITGDIFIDFFVKNGPINIGGVDIRCCPFDPGEPPDKGGPPPRDPGEDGGEDGDDDGDGELLSAAAAIEAGGPGIVGLSDTSSDEARALFFMAGLAMIVLGAHLVGREVYDKLPRRING